MKIRKAEMRDCQQIYELINYYANQGLMLPRSLNSVYENLRDFFVAYDEDGLRGCAALHICWEDLGEIKSLAVAEGSLRKGIGRMLVEAALDEARKIGLKKVFCLTYKPEFFEKLGFRRIDKENLPRKIWSECINCPKFPDCEEVALIYDL